MPTNVLTIPYPEELLLSLKKSPEEFEDEARLLLAVKLYELGRVSTGTAAQLAGMNRVEFMFALSRFGLSPIDLEPGELAEDLANAWTNRGGRRKHDTDHRSALIGQLDLLQHLYSEVVIPPAVQAEVLAGGPDSIGAAERQGANWIQTVSLQDPRRADLLSDLGRGEAEVITLAQELKAELLIVDERLARRHAKRLGLTLTGTLGVLLKTKERGLVPAVGPLIDQLRQSGTWLDDALVAEALRLAGEEA